MKVILLLGLLISSVAMAGVQCFETDFNKANVDVPKSICIHGMYATLDEENPMMAVQVISSVVNSIIDLPITEISEINNGYMTTVTLWSDSKNGTCDEERYSYSIQVKATVTPQGFLKGVTEVGGMIHYQENCHDHGGGLILDYKEI